MASLARVRTEGAQWFRYQSLVLGVADAGDHDRRHRATCRGKNPAWTARGKFFRSDRPDRVFQGPCWSASRSSWAWHYLQHQSAFAFGGGLLFQLAANLAFILHITGKPLGPPGTPTAEWLQWNALGRRDLFVAVAGARLLALAAKRGSVTRLKQDQFFLLQVSAAAWLFLAIAIWAAVGACGSRQRWRQSRDFLVNGQPNRARLDRAGLRRGGRVGPRHAPRPAAASVLVLMLIAATPLLAIRWELQRGRSTGLRIMCWKSAG